MSTTQPADGGTTRTGDVYTLPEFLRRTRMGSTAFRTARRNGLKVTRTAGRYYIRGADWDAYLLGQMAASAEATASQPAPFGFHGEPNNAS